MAETNFESFLANSNHRAQQHEAALKFHTQMSRAHSDAMNGCSEGDAAHAFHRAASTAHIEAGEFFSRCLSQKVAGAGDLTKGDNTLEPTPVMTIAIPRAGAPSARTETAPIFAKIFGGDVEE